MGTSCRTLVVLAVWVSWVLGASTRGEAQEVWRFILPEQRRMEIRDPTMLPVARLPQLPPPPTVADPQWDAPPQNLPLDEAIRTALGNSEVVRVLAGVTASSSGRTIYDPAVTNSGIDQARGEFDPTLDQYNTFNRWETPSASFVDPNDLTQVVIGGDATGDYEMLAGLSKKTVTGGSVGFQVSAYPWWSKATGLALNPQTTSSMELSFTQPLLRDGGSRVNIAPIVLARIDTERSFFQLKDSVQQLLRGVIEAYWNLVYARTDLWARQQQVAQGEESLKLVEATLSEGLGDAGDTTQARAAMANFRASLVNSEANVLSREAALRNILGQPPFQPVRIVPVSPPSLEWMDIDWEGAVGLAEEYRPDLIELKLILEADQQRLMLAKNEALPRIDASALYRWNGLEGTTPAQQIVSSLPGEFTGWQFGVNFSVPLGLRQARADLRRQELVVMRDQANLQQGLHNAAHALAASYRDLVQAYEQYRMYKEARIAAKENVEILWVRYNMGMTIYLNVLQAITDWGNAVSAEAQAATQYNIQLANLELQTGTILETHGVRFFEERYASIGPLGRLFRRQCYPSDYRPGPNVDRYQTTSEPAEQVFDLEVPERPPEVPEQPPEGQASDQPTDSFNFYGVPSEPPEPQSSHQTTDSLYSVPSEPPQRVPPLTPLR